MPYIGRTPTVGNFQVCDAISVVNGQAAYTLQVGGANVAPESANHMLVSLNGILQKPGSSFTISGSTMTFASNLATGDVIDFVQILGNVLDLGTPSDDTVTAAKLNNDIISGQTALTSAPDDTDELLISDGGTIKRIDVSLVKSSNTPAFMATRSGGDQTIANATYTLMSFNNEIIDTDSAYDNSAYTFTVPSGKNGTYLIGGQVAKNNAGSTDRLILKITKTTGGSETSFLFGEAYSKDYAKATTSKICTLAVGDILKCYAYQNTGGDIQIEQGEENSFFFAIKLG